MNQKSVSTSLFDRDILGIAFVDSFRKLTPRQQWKNPVMFVVYSRQSPDHPALATGP